MTRNFLIGFGALLIVLAAGFYFTKPSKLPKTQVVPSATPSIPDSAPIKEFSISGDEFSFTPSAITANSGDRIKISFTNNGNSSHDIVFEDFNIVSDTVNPGQTVTVEFVADKQGVFEFYCSVGGHKAFGMQGLLTVN